MPQNSTAQLDMLVSPFGEDVAELVRSVWRRVIGRRLPCDSPPFFEGLGLPTQTAGLRALCVTEFPLLRLYIVLVIGRSRAWLKQIGNKQSMSTRMLQ